MRKMSKVLIVVLIMPVLLNACFQYTPPGPVETPKTVITVIHGYSTTDLGIEDMLLEKITSEFPDVRLEWENVSWGDYFSSEIQARIASGEVPDIIIGKAQDVTSFQASGYLSAFDDTFTVNIRSEGLESVSVDGKIFGIPYDMLYQGVLYNKDIFEEHQLEPPRTIRELENVVTRLSRANVTPFASHFMENWYTANIKMQFAANRVFADDPGWGDEFRGGRRSFSDSGEFISCFNEVKFVFENSWEDSMLVTQRECLRRFSNGEAAMFVTGTWSVQTLQLIHPEMSVGIFPYPNKEEGAKLLYEPNITFMSNARSANKELADQIILSIIRDKELAVSVSSFTQTESMVKNAYSGSLSMIRDDLSYYILSDLLLDVSLGNNQIAWIFQDLCAKQTCLWLEGRLELERVLEFADANRTLSKW